MTTPEQNNLEKRIEQAILDDERTKGAQVDVLNNAGIVHLTGRVKDQKTREAAEEIAESQPGVTKVISDLAIGLD